MYQSLAGRAAVLQLLPLSLGEGYGRPGLSPRAIGHSKPPLSIIEPSENLFDTMFTGFHALEIKSAATFSPDFIQGLMKYSKILKGQKMLTGIAYGGDDSFTNRDVPIYSWRSFER